MSDTSFVVQPESASMSREPSQLMRFKNIHSMVTSEMARKSHHLSEVYTGAPVTSSTTELNALLPSPSPPPPSPCLSPSSVCSLLNDQPAASTTDSTPITPRTPMAPSGELSEMTKELLSFWEEIEPAASTTESLKLNYRLSLLMSSSKKYDALFPEIEHGSDDDNDETSPQESEAASEDGGRMDAFLAPDSGWLRNVNVSRMALNDVRPQSTIELSTGPREGEEATAWPPPLSPPPLVPVAAQRRASRASSSVRPMTSYELTTPHHSAKPGISIVVDAATAATSAHGATDKSGGASRFITWHTNALRRKTKSNLATTTATAAAAGNGEVGAEQKSPSNSGPMLSKGGRARSRSLTTTKEMASMLSANRGHSHEKTINKLTDMFTLRKEHSEPAGVKPGELSIDTFPDSIGIVFKKKSMIRRIFSGRKHRSHPEGGSRLDGTTGRRGRDRADTAPEEFADKTAASPDPLVEISHYEKSMKAGGKGRAAKARWSVQGAGLNLHDYQSDMLPSEAAQLRKEYIAKRARESSVLPTMYEDTPAGSSMSDSARSSSDRLAVEDGVAGHTAHDYASEWFEDDELEQLEIDRRKAVFNLIRCEQKHLRALVLLKGAFADPLRKAALDAEGTATAHFGEDKLDAIFGCAIKMIQFHKMFLRDLERSIKEHAQSGTLESAFMAFSNHASSGDCHIMHTMDELTVYECAEQVEHINIRALLSNPLEHIAHYHTFLQKILELYSYEDPEYQGFMKCVKQIRQIKSESTKLARVVRQSEEVKQVQASLKGLTFLLATPARQLIYQGNLAQIVMFTGRAKQRVCFLFNDMLVFAKERDNGQLHYKGHIDLEMASVLEVPADQMENAFVIMDKVDRSFYFQAETPNFCSQWICNLNETLGHPQVIKATGANQGAAKTNGRSPPVSPESESSFF
ncbi:hypothetical protein SYNPS1DRAFT_26451 [Syncephalis pseudoplumigaleata]|uniref:DH domain-containing protein n=1 Tax=Syncephalis pseudoplumigaleata TaxID=1712513 RepID=A0A4P9Z6W5_9FUNG|nr:hypothetical protein SYNPS1DRAFT_26451 [Syncephalis pseudoplumigaleata]|eukprot:RKP27922.1 hypothetical protein SYNPS1DRAFT_26451 [Syncephalis pseudoplumigaleata]